MNGTTRLSESQMNKWHTLVALAQVDGEACAAERDFIIKSLDARRIDPIQVEAIKNGFDSPEQPSKYFERISDPRDRGMLFYLARLMFFKDGKFCDLEKMYYDKFKASHMASLDMAEIQKELAAIERETKDSTPDGSFFGQFKSLVNQYF